MGEYAIDQMICDHQRMFGYTPERSDFESPIRTHKRPVCPKCGKKFKAHIAVRDHMRDKHAQHPTTTRSEP